MPSSQQLAVALHESEGEGSYAERQDGRVACRSDRRFLDGEAAQPQPDRAAGRPRTTAFRGQRLPVRAGQLQCRSGRSWKCQCSPLGRARAQAIGGQPVGAHAHRAACFAPAASAGVKVTYGSLAIGSMRDSAPPAPRLPSVARPMPTRGSTAMSRALPHAAWSRSPREREGRLDRKAYGSTAPTDYSPLALMRVQHAAGLKAPAQQAGGAR